MSEQGEPEQRPDDDRGLEREKFAEVARELSDRDQNDSEVQEIARQIGVFCRGLDEAGVKHRSYKENQDRKDSILAFVISEVGRLRQEQNDSEED